MLRAFAIVTCVPLLALDISVTVPPAKSPKPLDGRLLLLVSSDSKDEPRFQINDGLTTQMVFGMDVENWKPGARMMVTDTAFGYPVRKLSSVKPGEYFVQALLHKYETFHRSDGHTVKLPMDRGEGQQWNRAPGNLYSKPVKLALKAGGRFSIELTEEIPPIPELKDTKYIRHIRIQSERLTKFWGRPMFLGAHVLVPEGFDEHPAVRYPLMLFHGHFPADFDGFRPEPPDPNLKADYSEAVPR